MKHEAKQEEARAPRLVAQGLKKRFGRRVVLAGDAAHLNSPAGGQGLNAGLLDTEHLRAALVGALARPFDAASLLAAYERDRVRDFDRHIRGLTDALERMEAAPAFLRRIGFSSLFLLRVFGFERLVARRLSMIDAA